VVVVQHACHPTTLWPTYMLLINNFMRLVNCCAHAGHPVWSARICHMKAAEQSCLCHHCDKLLTPATCLPLCTQATLSGVLTAGMFYFISNAKPLPQLSPVRPHPSIFCAYFFASLLGQFVLQLGFLVVMYRWVARHELTGPRVWVSCWGLC
jgi:hypothetical protein